VGQWVLYFNPRKLRGKQMKWIRQYEGPFLTTAMPSPLTAKIQRTAKIKAKTVHIDKLKEYSGTPLKSWMPSTTNGEAGVVVDEATPGSVLPEIQVGEALEIAAAQSTDLPDISPKKTKSKLSRGRKEERGEEEERNDRCVAEADKTESVSDNVSDSTLKCSKESEAGIAQLAGKPLTDHGTDQVKPGSGSGEDGEVTQQISESPLTDHETVHVQRNEAEREEVENQPSVETPLSGECPRGRSL